MLLQTPIIYNKLRESKLFLSRSLCTFVSAKQLPSNKFSSPLPRAIRMRKFDKNSASVPTVVAAANAPNKSCKNIIPIKLLWRSAYKKGRNPRPFLCSYLFFTFIHRFKLHFDEIQRAVEFRRDGVVIHKRSF